MKHNYELEFIKGEHKDYLDSYVWECANCGAVSLTDTLDKPCEDCRKEGLVRDQMCIRVRLENPNKA